MKFIAVSLLGLLTAVSAQAQSESAFEPETQKLITACTEFVRVVGDARAKDPGLTLSADQTKSYDNCTRLLQKHDERRALQREVDEKEGRNAALRAENAAMMRENYELAVETLLRLAPEGMRWSTERDCDLLFVQPNGTVVQILPQGVDPARTQVLDGRTLRLYPNESNGLNEVLDRDFNTKPLSSYDFALNTTRLSALSNDDAKLILDGLPKLVISLHTYCATR
ncbi:MAG: hypothetical protein QNJ09_11985 [Paracoccaceae bacterium]|nr:hypothetical protein [Paracoccaceae bacterium]